MQESGAEPRVLPDGPVERRAGLDALLVEQLEQVALHAVLDALQVELPGPVERHAVLDALQVGLPGQVERHAALDVLPVGRLGQVDLRAVLGALPVEQPERVELHAVRDALPVEQPEQVALHAVRGALPADQQEQQAWDESHEPWAARLEQRWEMGRVLDKRWAMAWRLRTPEGGHDSLRQIALGSPQPGAYAVPAPERGLCAARVGRSIQPEWGAH